MLHPTAIIDPSAQLDPSVTVGPYAIIDGPARISAHCRIEAHAQLVGDVRIGEGTVVGRGAIIGGEPQDLSFDPATQSHVEIGRNNTIREHVTIHRSTRAGECTRVGDGNYLMAGCHLGHDARIGDKNVLANGCYLGGHVQLGNGSFIGGGAVFHQFIRVGDVCVIQGNSGCSQDVPHYCAAHSINLLGGLNVIGLRRQGFSAADRAAIKEMFDLLFRSDLNLTQAIAKAREKEWPECAGRLLEFMAAPSKKGVCRMPKD